MKRCTYSFEPALSSFPMLGVSDVLLVYWEGFAADAPLVAEWSQLYTGRCFPFHSPCIGHRKAPGEMLQAAVWCSIFSILGNVFRASEPEDATFVFSLAPGMFRVDQILFFFLIQSRNSFSGW